MKERIEKYVFALKETSKTIRKDLEEYFDNYDYSNPKNDVQIIEINNESDLDKIIYGNGFYIILTDKKFVDNECTFKYQGLKPIYRGHSYFTKKRIKSHLSNDDYNSKIKRGETHYKVCIKLKSSVNGININQEPYKNWKWIIIVHKMPNSSELVREQTEKAFDKIFKKPCKSIK